MTLEAIEIRRSMVQIWSLLELCHECRAVVAVLASVASTGLQCHCVDLKSVEGICEAHCSWFMLAVALWRVCNTTV